MLMTMKELIDRANAENYAIAAPVVQTEQNARAAIKCAEELNAPLILLIPLIFDYDVFLFGRYLRELAGVASVPVAINHDHGSDFKSAIECIRAGFTSIMVDRSMLPYEENVAQVKELVKIAHAVGVTVEAELGHVGMANTYDEDRDIGLTEPEQASKFIKETGIDCLAVAIGTAHGAYNRGQIPVLDYNRLAQIKMVTNNFPLVLHGGSGTGDESLSKVCKMGINKVNIGCELFASAIEELENSDTSGNGAYGLANIIEAGYSKRLKHFIKILGSENKVWVPERKNTRVKIERTNEMIM
jgi:fructose-bisphosphate aldolase class II